MAFHSPKRGIWSCMKKRDEIAWIRRKKPERWGEAGLRSNQWKFPMVKWPKDILRTGMHKSCDGNSLFCLPPDPKFIEFQSYMLWGYVWLMDLEIAYKAKFDIWGHSVLSGENKPMRNRSLEQRWAWAWGCLGIWKKVWREGRCFGLALSMEQGLELILSTFQGARIPWPTSGLHIYD